MYERPMSRAGVIFYGVLLAISLALVVGAIAGDYRWWLLWL